MKAGRRRREGTEELFLSGVPTEIAKEFKALEKGRGLLGADLTHGQLFVLIYNEWKRLKGGSRGTGSDPKSGLLRVGGLEELGDEAAKGKSEKAARGQSPSHIHPKE